MPPIIELSHLSRTFSTGPHRIKAVDDLSLSIGEGEIVCLVGESGCGKTTTARMVVGLLPPSSGQILYRGENISQLRGAAYTRYRLGVQLIHQDPYASLNPAHKVYDMLLAPLRRHHIARNLADAQARARELMEGVGLTPADDFLDKFPHQLSGGQRQRVSIARALTVNPSFLVADEAVSMLDMSIRIGLLNILLQLREKMGLSVLFITHDLALANYFARDGQIGVMYLGRLVELASTRQIIERPQHPYTQALLAAVPEVDPDQASEKKLIELRSPDIPSLQHLPPGCAFHPRCPRFEGEQCQKVVPELTRFDDGSAAACHPVIREHARVGVDR